MAAASAASAAQQHLRRIWQQLPLHRLKQGTTLSIASKLRDTHLLFRPAWRDDGHVTLEQHHVAADRPTQLQIQHQGDTKTSMGRIESHISLELLERQSDTKTGTTHDDGGPTTSAVVDDQDEDPSRWSLHKTNKPIRQALVDDGTNLEPIESVHVPVGSKRVDYNDGVAHYITPNRDSKKDSSDKKQQEQPVRPGHKYITIDMPEKINLNCQIQHGSVTIMNKIEGDVHCQVVDGDICVKKLRGHVLDLQTQHPNNVIYASTLLEAQKLSIRTCGGRVRAKQIHANMADIAIQAPTNNSSGGNGGEDEHLPPRIMDTDDDEGSLVDVSSLFVAGTGGATVSVNASNNEKQAAAAVPLELSRRAVRIKSSHGPVQVSITNYNGVPPTERNPMTDQVYPLVELGGVNGSCEVAIAKSTSSAAGNNNNEEGWASCQLHVDSLAQDSVSLVTADVGDIAVTLDRKVEADLRLASLPDAECLTETGALLAEEENPKLVVDVLRQLGKQDQRNNDDKTKTPDSTVDVRTKAYTSRPETTFHDDSISYADGWVENKSHEPDSRFEQRVRGQESGSIGKIRIDSAADQALQGFGEEEEEKKEEGEDDGSDSSNFLRPLLAVAGTEHVSVETVSWLGAIARRYGLEEESGRRDLGRTATRRGRPIIAPVADGNK